VEWAVALELLGLRRFKSGVDEGEEVGSSGFGSNVEIITRPLTVCRAERPRIRRYVVVTVINTGADGGASRAWTGKAGLDFGGGASESYAVVPGRSIMYSSGVS
jgi:hypothetical protein